MAYSSQKISNKEKFSVCIKRKTKLNEIITLFKIIKIFSLFVKHTYDFQFSSIICGTCKHLLLIAGFLQDEAKCWMSRQSLELVVEESIFIILLPFLYLLCLAAEGHVYILVPRQLQPDAMRVQLNHKRKALWRFFF